MVYINGRPFVLREVESPFTNLEHRVGVHGKTFDVKHLNFDFSLLCLYKLHDSLLFLWKY